MAGFEVNFPTDFMGGILNSSFEDIAKEALEEAAPLMEKSIKQSLQNSIRDKSSGDLVKSVKVSRPKRTKTNAWIVNIGPSGTDSKGVRNALKAIILNYGKKGQAPRPWLTPAVNNCQTEINLKIQQKYEEKTR